MPHDNSEASAKPKTKAEPAPTHWVERLRTAVPTRTALANHRWLKPIAHHVLDPKLWRMHHESVARGAAIGVFWSFVIPVAQVLVAVAHCVWWRGNIAVAAGVTLITNPLTVAFWLWLAYKVGSVILNAPPPIKPAEGSGMVAYLAALGGPTVLGMGIFAVGGAVSAYALVKIVWRLQFWLKHRNRSKRQKKAP